MKQILLLILTFTFTNIFAQVTDTTFISADNQGKLYRTTVTIDQVTGKKITTDDPITDFYAPGYLRLVDFDASNNTEFFLDNNSKVKSYITLGDEYKIILN